MHFGALVPQGWKHDLDGLAPREAFDTMISVAQRVEAVGLDSVWLYDHMHAVPPPAQPGTTVFECWTSLAAIAMRTERVRLGQMVTCTPYRNPGLLAKIAATVDVASNGRLEMGLGAGWYWEEFNSYGYGFPEAKERLGILRDTVNIIKRMWRDERSTYEGKYASVTDAICDPKPIQQPRPPIWIGGGGEQVTLKIVAQHADWSNFMGTTENFKAKRDILRKHCDDIGRDWSEIRMSIMPDCLVAPDQASIDALQAKHPSLFGVPADQRREAHLIGTVQQVIDRIGAYKELGCDGVVCWFADYPQTDSLDLFASEVVPAFR